MTQTTSWIWRGGDNVVGVRLDSARGLLFWTTEIGCHCDDDDGLAQSLAAYREDGTPPTIPPPPEEVRAELEQALAHR